jgi:hypothetical protein
VTARATPEGWTETRAHRELEEAHARAVGAASTGLQDAHLGGLRLTGSGVPVLAETAVTSATPYLRAPLLGRMSAALLLHPPGGEPDDRCPTCGTAVPCATAQVLSW